MSFSPFFNKLDYLIFCHGLKPAGPVGHKQPSDALSLSYCVIRSVIMHILFWVIMLLYAIFSSIVLCYNLFIIPLITSKNSLSSSLGRLLRWIYQTCQYSLITAKTQECMPLCQGRWGLTPMIETFFIILSFSSGASSAL